VYAALEGEKRAIPVATRTYFDGFSSMILCSSSCAVGAAPAARGDLDGASRRGILLFCQGFAVPEFSLFI
jgi:hypothetical protein